MKRAAELLRGFTKEESGAVFIWVAVSLTAVFGLAAMAIDTGHLYVLRNQLQTSADSAALAGATRLSSASAMRQEAKKYAQLNMPGTANVLMDADIESGNWNQAARVFTVGGNPENAVRTTVRMSQANGNAAPTFFAKVLGFDDVDITTQAVAAYDDSEEWDVLVVQDVTGSFSAEISDARDANHALLDCLSQRTSGDSLVGMVTFTGVAQDYSALATLEDGYDGLSTLIDGLDSCGNGSMPPCSGTHVGAGMERALGMFNATPGAPSGGRAMVILGDGAPNAKGPNIGYTNAQLMDIARQASDDAEASGISVYTVFYDENNDDTAAQFFEDLVRGDGEALRTPDASALPELFASLCAQLPLRLVQ